MKKMKNIVTPVRAFAALAVLGLAPQLQGCVEMAVVGAGAAVMAADDRRTVGAQAEDKEIGLRAESRISSRFGEKVHINVNSYNRNALLTGEAPDAATKQIAGVSTYSARGNDSYLTSKVKARLIDRNSGISANHVKVVTENGVVYLLGLVTRKEAESAVEVARTTGGVQKVVRVFEYIEPPAK